MKTKIIMFSSTVLLLLTLLCLEKYIASLDYNACNIIEVNDLYKNIEADRESMTLTELENKYNCNIILREEDDYSNQLYQAIRKSNIIIDYMDGETLLGKIILPANSNSLLQLKRNMQIAVAVAFAAILLIGYWVVFFIYRRIILPFQRMERFAENISKGDLDVPLVMDRENYFGAFTESFDVMREELRRARQGEYEANVSKKELVAELSHDIKTPVATIKALCELLEIKVKEEDTITKVRTINQKADVIDKLISNMFHATLEELEVLKIEPREELSTIVNDMFADLNHFGKIHRKNEMPGCLIYCDRLRLNQVIDNIINNSYKYANTDIDVTYQEGNKTIEIEIRDHGTSFQVSELPLIFEKFYRGGNASSQSGAGLGLYLAKQFMEGMDGEIECKVDHGFVVKLTVKKV